MCTKCYSNVVHFTQNPKHETHGDTTVTKISFINSPSFVALHPNTVEMF